MKSLGYDLLVFTPTRQAHADTESPLVRDTQEPALDRTDRDAAAWLRIRCHMQRN